MAAIKVDNLNKKYRIPHQKRTTLFQNILGVIKRQQTYEEFWAVKGVSFEVERGETFGIIGRNGSGKSTLLKMLSRVIYPDFGSIVMNGKVAAFLELGVGFQPELSAAENVYIYAAILGMSRKEIHKVYEEIFAFAELKKFEDMKLKNFSTGMYLRLSFSTAIMAAPDIILIDEVLSVGDEAFQKKCANKIMEFKEQGKTIVVVSHDLHSIGTLCSRTLLLEKGQVLSIDRSDSVLDQYLAMVN
jgi:lipopolysaccharide transport system ATP-binding protein